MWFWEVLRVPREVIFGTFLDKIDVFCEKVEPSFLHTLTAFWLDFQAVGLPKIAKKRKKGSLKIIGFLGCKKVPAKSIF